MTKDDFKKAAGANIGKETKENPVEVTMIKDESAQGRGYVVRVSVRSKLRPASLMVGSFPANEISSMSGAKNKVEVLAGSLSEQIAERLGDNLIDPSEMAKFAGEAWEDLLKKPASAFA